MSRSKNTLVPGLQATKGVTMVADEFVNTTTSGATDAVFLTCTTAGLATVTPSGQSTDITIYLNAGQVFPLQVTRIRSAGLAAVGTVGLWS